MNRSRLRAFSPRLFKLSKGVTLRLMRLTILGSHRMSFILPRRNCAPELMRFSGWSYAPLGGRRRRWIRKLRLMPSSGVAERVTEILREYDVNTRLTSFTDETDYSSSDAIVVFRKVSGGFELPSSRLVVHVEGDLFDEAAEPALERRATAIRREKKRRARAAAFLSYFRD